MHLYEVFESPYEYEWEDSGDTYAQATFFADDKSFVEVEISKEFNEYMPEDTWMVEFHRSNPHGDMERHVKTADVSNQGDAYKIFATVGEIMKEFVRRNSPNALWFTAAEPSRRMLYKRMLPRLARALGMHAEQGDTPSEFWLKKNEAAPNT